MKTIFPLPNRIKFHYGDAAYSFFISTPDKNTLDSFNDFFMSSYRPQDLCHQSFLLNIDDNGAFAYTTGDMGAHYAKQTAKSLLNENRRLPKCRIVYIPHQKNRQVSLRAPKAFEFNLFMNLLNAIADLKYTSVYFRNLQNSDLYSLQKQQIATLCKKNYIQTNLTDSSLIEYAFELDASSVVGFELRTRFDYLEKIGDAKVSYDGEYKAEALADSGFIFRLTAGALAMNQPDFGNDYWDKTLESAMDHSFKLTRELSAACSKTESERLPMNISTCCGAEIPEPCDAVELHHTLLTPAKNGETLGQYVLHLSGGSSHTEDIVMGRNIGPANASWGHKYNAVEHRFDTDAVLQTVCCYTRPRLYMNAESQLITLYTLTLCGGYSQIQGIEVNLKQGVELKIHSASVIY